MPLIHAHSRKAPVTVSLFGVDYKFAADSAGKFVCEVPDGEAADRLLAIPEGYIVFGNAPVEQTLAKPEKAAEAAEDEYSPYVLSIGDEGGLVDLRLLDKGALLAFIAEHQLDYKPRANATEQAIRDNILKALAVE